MSNANEAPCGPQALIALLERQQSLVEELSELTTRQTELIDQANTDALLGLLTRRQDVIQRFTEAQQDLGRLTDDLGSEYDGIDDGERGKIQQLISDIGAALARVMERDEADQRRLEAARGTARDELGVVDTARQARQAYIGARAVNNRFADRKG